MAGFSFAHLNPFSGRPFSGRPKAEDTGEEDKAEDTGEDKDKAEDTGEEDKTEDTGEDKDKAGSPPARKAAADATQAERSRWASVLGAAAAAGRVPAACQMLTGTDLPPAAIIGVLEAIPAAAAPAGNTAALEAMNGFARDLPRVAGTGAPPGRLTDLDAAITRLNQQRGS